MLPSKTTIRKRKIKRTQTTSAFHHLHDHNSNHPISHQSVLEQDQIDANEMKLLTQAEITDEHGSIVRIQKMATKDVYNLKEGEKILVHVNEFCQPIKAAGGLCTRFMTLLLKKPELCPPDARNWREVKVRCGVRLLGELRRKFNLPQGESVDKVIFAIFDVKYRTLKHTFKKTVFRLAADKLNEVNNIVDGSANYTQEELLQALDLIELPSNFLDHQWELYKSHLRTPKAKKLSQNGKKARADQLHTHSTGAVSYARLKDEFKLKNKREANDVEFFDIAYQTKKGSYVGDSSKQLMDQAQAETGTQLLDIGTSETIEPETRSEIESDVMRELISFDKPGRARGYGAGVTKSQVTKFSFDLRKMRSEVLTKQNHMLSDKMESQSQQIESQSKQIESQSKQIESQSKQIESLSEQIESQNKQIKSQSKKMKIMEQRIDENTRELQVIKNALQELYSARKSKDPSFTTPHVPHEDTSSTQVSTNASSEDCQ